MNKSNTDRYILFIDDEPACHILAKLIIPNNTSYKLLSAYSGAEALKLAREYENDIEVILCDISMPDISGYEIYSRLQQNDRLANVSFIFQSGHSDQTYQLNLLEGKKKPTIIYKPYKQNDLIKAILDAS